jgi:hypothetical protein
MNSDELEEGEIQAEENQNDKSSLIPVEHDLPQIPPTSKLSTTKTPTPDAPQTDVLSKPIKRREVNESEEFSNDIGEDRYVEDSADYSNFSSLKSIKEYEKEAKADLISFLQKKSLDASWAEFYSLNIRPSKQRKDVLRKSLGPGYSVTYTNPEGGFLASKTDVLSDIQDRMIRKSQKSSVGLRAKAHEEGKQRMKELDLPRWFDNIFLLEVGKIDTRSGFHSAIHLYPIGYKCEQSVTGLTVHKGVTEQDIVCEIAELDGFPEFRITVKSTGSVLSAFSEAAVWRKVRKSDNFFFSQFLIDFFLLLAKS